MSSPTGKHSSSLMPSEWARLVWTRENTTETMQKEWAEIPDLPWSIFPEKQQASATCVTPSLWGPFFISFHFHDSRHHKQLNSSTQGSGDRCRAGPGTRDLPTPAPQPWPVSPEPVPSEPNHYQQVPQQLPWLLNGQTLTTWLPLQVSLIYIFPGATNPRTE